MTRLPNGKAVSDSRNISQLPRLVDEAGIGVRRVTSLGATVNTDGTLLTVLKGSVPADLLFGYSRGKQSANDGSELEAFRRFFRMQVETREIIRRTEETRDKHVE